jgi:peroxiredoxin
MTTPTPQTSIDRLVLALLFLSLAGNVYLGVAVLRWPDAPTRRPDVVVGSVLKPFEAVDLKGRPYVVNTASTTGNTVFYVFTPSCVWCSRNLANLRALLAAAGDRYSVIGVSLDPNVDSYLKSNGLNFTVLVRPSRQTIATYGLGGTPQTIVVSPTGTVLRVWRGAYGGAAQKEVAEFFGVNLPGFNGGVSVP